MSKKRHRHKIHKQPSSMVNLLRSLKDQRGHKDKIREIRHTYSLTETDRISYVYQINSQNTIIEVTCVSYDLFVGNQWFTLVYYDNCHGGVLHRHVKLNIAKNIDIPNIYGVKKNGSSKKLLSWANKDLRNKYLDYRKGFIRRNRTYLKDNNIDMS